MHRSTIADVARLAGVSQATVSRALRGMGNVTQATREKVQAAADALNFTLSKSASSLASGKTMQVILLSSGRLNEWFNANVLEGVCEVLIPEGYDVLPASIVGKDEADAYFENLPKNRNVDAIIISSFQLDETDRQRLDALDMPVIGVNTPAAATFCDAAVGVDNYVGMEQAVRLARSLGHASIAFAADCIPSNIVYNTTQRVEAFLEAAEQNGYGENCVDVISVDPHDLPLAQEELASRLVAKLLASSRRPTAVCAETDRVAISLVKELRRQHLRVPEDISVIGFDDADVAEAADLTTVRQDPIELGRVAARKTLQLLELRQRLAPGLVDGSAWHGQRPAQRPTVDSAYETQQPSIVLRGTTGKVNVG